MTKTNQNFNPVTSKIWYEDLLKVDEKNLLIGEENIKQILKDLNRTYPHYKLFHNEKTQEKLKNVLRAFSNYDKEICYFQGMNFIVGFFWFHCEEYIAFWLFVSLIEEYDFRNWFMKGFPGWTYHTTRVREIIRRNYKEINIWFHKFNLELEILMVEWLFSLFSSLIPLEKQLYFYTGFYSEGWEFFYKMCVSVFLNLSGQFDDAEDVYMALKCGKNDNVDWKVQAKNWEKIIKGAYNIVFDVNENVTDDCGK